ncbi:restriction endonuclease subunit S [Pseudomonas sp. TAE6080]|uniref:restriction endonuclease subunit S n=1 Tax=Pseudomonas sp. TAE6080 TaxID=2840374 RepID=UPI001C006EEE|nr:restriction endonuclease subunit S [Pseudomonas sp. TAE6080]MBT9304948.1 restriction endonuclease subunit S [Pseudomonas sp. TAE6080]
MSMVTAEWVPMKLDELGSVGRGKSRHRPRNAAHLYGGPYPFFQTGDIKAANFYLTDYSQTYSEDGLAQSKLWKPGTLCITIAANIAESAILSIEGCFPDSVVGFVADPAKADVRFIKYYMEILKLQMQNVSRGTTQDNLSVDKLLSFNFLVPSLPVQQRIAGILSAYDELIENSQRRIKILETMARALYREWFVHFRFSGHESIPRIASPLGEIPQGWKVKKLGDVVRFGTGKAIKPGGEGLYPVYGSNGIIGGSDESRHENGVVIGRVGAYCGAVVYCRSKFWASDNTLVAYPASKEVNAEFLYSLLAEAELSRYAGGAAQPLVTQTVLKQVEVLMPPTALLEVFGEVAGSFERQTATLQRQSQNLRRTRDLLLPRLLSGQIDIEAIA